MRADRLLSILLLLQTNRRLTAGELARRLGVSPRTIYRDMDALSAAGVPVVAERGSAGGWALLDDYRTDLTGLTEAESRALFLAAPARPLADLGLGQAAEAALIKLLAALPAMTRHAAEYARQRIYVDTAGWRQAEEPLTALPVLQDAVWRERTVRLAYCRGDGTTVERLVDPLGLVAKGRIWYLVAAVEGELRTYRVSRVLEATPTEEPCARPTDFDLAAYWERSSADFRAARPHYRVTVRAAAGDIQQIGRLGGFVRILRTDPPGTGGCRTAALLYETADDACRSLVGFGDLLEVVVRHVGA